MDRVIILLSTYNGEKYINTQLDSLLNQSYKNIRVLIRDDGSKDNTVSIIKKYVLLYPDNIELIEGTNVGVIKSFMELVKKYKGDSEYVAFCDQDDFWEPIKIEKAINILDEKESKIKGYCSNLKLVDDNLKFLNTKYNRELKPSFYNAIFENIVTGCTFIANNELIFLLKSKIDSINLNNILMHDWLLYIIGTSFGEVIYDENSYIQYRQHANNVVGMDTDILSKIKRRTKNFFKFKNRRIKQVKEFYVNYKDELPEDKKKYLDKLINAKTIIKRMEFIFKEKIFRQNELDSFITRVMILFKIY